MLIELVAAVATGLGAAGLALLLRRLAGGRLPRAVVPVAAGLGMLAFAIWSEYSWFERSTGGLPAGVVVTAQVAERSPWRPWTWAWPRVTRYTAVDAAGARANPALPGHVLADVWEVGRYAPPSRRPQLVDCPGGRRAGVTAELRFDDAGRPLDPRWQALAPDDPLYQALCPGADATAQG